MKIKLLIASHKGSEKKQGFLATVQAGAALSPERFPANFYDDQGENISRLNPSYNELTVLYWAWKNYDLLGDPDAIGLMHYRRYFYFDEKAQDCVLRTNASEELFAEKAKISEDRAEVLLRSFDFVAPRPAKRRSVEKQYAITHDPKDISLCLSLIEELYPSYLPAARTYFKGKDCYFFNMFVFPKDIFFRYCEFIFPLLAAFTEKKGDHDRLFISERLTGVFITALLREGKSVVYLPVLYREESGEDRLSVFKKEWKTKKGIKGKLLCFRRLFISRRRENRRIV